jgi:signal transduction histidine kinase
MRQLEQSREQERARIARDLHDRLGGSLTGLKLDLSRARESLLTDMVDAEARLAALSGEISRLIDMVRQIALELRPAMLDDLGLLPAMEWQFQEVIRRTGLTGDFAGDVDSARVSDEVATACFRVFQEALTNVARHASATQVQAHVGLAGESLVLHVHDNGRGLPPETAGATHHLGLASMRERTEMLSGHLDIHSAPGHGTTVVATIPLAAPTPEALAVSPDHLATPAHGPYVLRTPAWSGAPAQERFTT